MIFFRTLPGNSTYADISKHGEKVFIVSNFMFRWINLENFENCLDKGTIRRCFGGATAKQMVYDIDEVLREENPDKIIFCIGTNNLTRNQQQSELEIANEIINIVNKQMLQKWCKRRICIWFDI